MGNTELNLNNNEKKEVTNNIFDNPVSIEAAPKKEEPIESKGPSKAKIIAIAIFDENNKILIRTGLTKEGKNLTTLDDLKNNLSRPIDGCVIKVLTDFDPYKWIKEEDISF